MHGAFQLDNQVKSISAVKPKREGGHSRAKRRTHDGNHLRWKRLTETWDGAVKALQNCPPHKVDELIKVVAVAKGLLTPLTRLVYVGHLTVTQAMAARRYIDIVRKFERFHMAASARSARSANLEPARGVEDQELERIINNGKLREYEAAAKVAKREYKRCMKVLDKFADPITGRNYAKDQIDDLCIFDREPATESRKHIAAVLEMLAKEFAVKERR